jgi:TetR/AcrR family transcriptional repressor of nem operon
LFARFAADAEGANDDPLQRTMLFLKSFEGFIEGLAQPVGGVRIAAYTYESLQFDAPIHAFIAHSLRRSTGLYEKKFEAVLGRYKPVRPVTARDLADMIVALIEGGFILTRAYNDATLVARQSRQFRQYLELLFPGPAQ